MQLDTTPQPTERTAAVPPAREPQRGADRQIGFSELKKWLRHRHPMIYIDRITDHEPGVFLRSLLSVSGNLDAIAGHFPERAIYPGSHLMQAFAQSGIILYQLSTSPLADDELTLIGSVKSRFTSPVVPGDQVVFDVRADRLVGTTFFFSCQATVDGLTVAAFRGTLTRRKVSDLGRQLW
ncbi:3-hydroxyacyl-ACP dehydratase FabZ family protein [Streptomyces triticirhizae]|uniref:Beta-hydroxyacyl-ACP dehydratase n=1 Tax=Streptomyces triticirhizae TaxID=2483353 RepID=A0A3M2M9R7_9ACTN|nr:beta-hydroxyacyl-ACP dehydratase [Streptomyces triticirhizae]RMI46219.1 beta-hydroxyacyl-ACP dehydratase [Streptomyces triticirhizae]